MSDQTTVPVTPRQLGRILESQIPSGEPLFVWGSPGIGKSELMRQAAEKLSLRIIEIRAPLYKPEDFVGLPWREGDRTKFCPPTFLPEDDGSGGVLFIDELGQAEPSTQKIFMQLCLDRRVGEWPLPDGWFVTAASNRATDRAGVSRVITPLLDRFVHFDLLPDVDEWLDWAAGAGVSSLVRSFIAFRRELLSNFNPSVNDKAFATPRCYDAETEVLTADGFKPWPEVTMEDSLATITFDGKLEYHQPTELHSYDHEGDMLHFRQQHLDLMVTANHKVLVQQCYERGGPADAGRNLDTDWHLIEADLCSQSMIGSRTFRMRKDCVWEGGDDGEMFVMAAGVRRCNEQMPAREVPADILFEFLGWWVADGTYRHRDGGYFVVITQVDPVNRQRIADLITQMGFKAHVSSDRVVVCDKQLYSLVEPLGKREERRVPRFVIDASHRLMRSFIKGLVGGDGWDSNGTTYVATGLSRHVADAVQEMMVRLGLTANVSRREEHNCWIVGLMGERYLRPILSLEGTSRVFYRGKVYCATVPNHTLLVRRNGKVVWSGNSWVKVDRLVKGAHPEDLYATVAGKVGIGAASEFCAFAELHGKLPSFDEILKKPSTHPLPGDDEPSLCWAVIGGLSDHVKGKDMKAKQAAAVFMLRMDAGFKAYGIRSLAYADRNVVAQVKEVREWCMKNMDAMKMSK